MVRSSLSRRIGLAALALLAGVSAGCGSQLYLLNPARLTITPDLLLACPGANSLDGLLMLQGQILAVENDRTAGIAKATSLATHSANCFLSPVPAICTACWTETVDQVYGPP